MEAAELPAPAGAAVGPLTQAAALGRYRIVVRVRPEPRGTETEGPAVVEVLGKARLRVLRSGLEPLELQVDEALGPSASQSDVFNAVRDVVVGVVGGRSGTVLTYGQTGSGKTYTMAGEAPALAQHMADVEVIRQAFHSEQRGLIPRALELLFKRIKPTTIQERVGRSAPTWRAYVSFMEIYAERVYDLLVSPGRASEAAAVADRAFSAAPGGRGAAPPGRGAAGSLTIKEDADGVVSVPGMTVVEVQSLDQALEVLRIGTAGRTSRDNGVNLVSSRSHAIFQLILERRQGGQTPHTAKLNFVDLAGSEKLRSHNSGVVPVLQELTSINFGLSALGQCISALVAQRTHVPYRDSKLTRLLQDSLNGQSQTTMCVCISPTPSALEETLSSLKFADRAKRAILDRREPPPTCDAAAERRVEELVAQVQELQEALRLEREARQGLERLLQRESAAGATSDGALGAGREERDKNEPPDPLERAGLIEHDKDQDSPSSAKGSSATATPDGADVGSNWPTPGCPRWDWHETALMPGACLMHTGRVHDSDAAAGTNTMELRGTLAALQRPAPGAGPRALPRLPLSPPDSPKGPPPGSPPGGGMRRAQKVLERLRLAVQDPGLRVEQLRRLIDEALDEVSFSPSSGSWAAGGGGGSGTSDAAPCLGARTTPEAQLLRSYSTFVPTPRGRQPASNDEAVGRVETQEGTGRTSEVQHPRVTDCASAAGNATSFSSHTWTSPELPHGSVSAGHLAVPPLGFGRPLGSMGAFGPAPQPETPQRSQGRRLGERSSLPPSAASAVALRHVQPPQPPLRVSLPADAASTPPVSTRPSPCKELPKSARLTPPCRGVGMAASSAVQGAAVGVRKQQRGASADRVILPRESRERDEQGVLPVRVGWQSDPQKCETDGLSCRVGAEKQAASIAKVDTAVALAFTGVVSSCPSVKGSSLQNPSIAAVGARARAAATAGRHHGAEVGENLATPSQIAARCWEDFEDVLKATVPAT